MMATNALLFVVYCHASIGAVLLSKDVYLGIRPPLSGLGDDCRSATHAVNECFLWKTFSMV